MPGVAIYTLRGVIPLTMGITCVPSDPVVGGWGPVVWEDLPGSWVGKPSGPLRIQEGASRSENQQLWQSMCD